MEKNKINQHDKNKQIMWVKIIVSAVTNQLKNIKKHTNFALN